MILRKTKTQAPETASSDEPPFDRGFWSGKKGSAIGSTSSGERGDEPVFTHKPSLKNNSQSADNVDGLLFGSSKSNSYPADLRREGPFAKDKIVVPKATIEPSQSTQTSQSDVFHPSGVRTIGSSSPASQKRILQLDDFEPQTKAWRRTQKEPAAPRVHPNPTPVVPVKNGKAKATKSKKPSVPISSSTFSSSPQNPSATDYTPPHASTDKPSIVMPLAMIFTLFVLIGGGYVYLSNLSEQNSQEANLASRERQVKLAETMLLNLGYQPGTIDGKSDASLTSAVKAFQRDALLEEDGLVTPQLIIEIEAIQKIFESS